LNLNDNKSFLGLNPSDLIEVFDAIHYMKQQEPTLN